MQKIQKYYFEFVPEKIFSNLNHVFDLLHLLFYFSHRLDIGVSRLDDHVSKVNETHCKGWTYVCPRLSSDMYMFVLGWKKVMVAYIQG